MNRPLDIFEAIAVTLLIVIVGIIVGAAIFSIVKGLTG